MESGTRIGEPARRQHDRSFKANLVEQSLQLGASVAVIARHNGINANLLFPATPIQCDFAGRILRIVLPHRFVLAKLRLEARSKASPVQIAFLGPGLPPGVLAPPAVTPRNGKRRLANLAFFPPYALKGFEPQRRHPV